LLIVMCINLKEIFSFITGKWRWQFPGVERMQTLSLCTQLSATELWQQDDNQSSCTHLYICTA